MKTIFVALVSLLFLPTAEAKEPHRNTGTLRVLVLRVDFPDVPDTRPASYFAEVMAAVRAKYEEASYGKVDLVTTVSAETYRMPHPGSYYALNRSENGLGRDACVAARRDYPTLVPADTNTAYDRIIIEWPALRKLPGSTMKWTGHGHGQFVWLNGTFVFKFVAHELGHTFGNGHANAQKPRKLQERGDPFDIMGGAAIGPAHDFNPYLKWKMGWVSDNQIQTVTTSGIYRVNRFDYREATGVFALRVGNLYISYRRAFPATDPISNGAYIVRPDGIRKTTTVLLDMNPATPSALDAALPVGKSYRDPGTGATITPTEAGGTAPHEYLEIKVTI